jgi:hypothetical protein
MDGTTNKPSIIDEWLCLQDWQPNMAFTEHG